MFGLSGLASPTVIACPALQPGGEMDFTPSPRVRELRDRIADFMERHVIPAEREIVAQADLVRPGVPYPPALVPIRQKAKAEGLWNLFLPDEEHGAGLQNWEDGLLCERMGWRLG